MLRFKPALIPATRSSTPAPQLLARWRPRCKPLRLRPRSRNCSLGPASPRPCCRWQPCFFATLTSPVVVDGRTIIPSGTSVTCRVDGAHGGRRIGGKPWLAIRAVSVQLPSGEVLQFTASMIDTATPRKLDVDQEGRVRGATFSPMDKIETGALAGTGLIAGAVIAGGPAAIFIGAASGVAVGAGHTLIKHKDLTLAAGTQLIFQLDSPATVHNQVEASM